VETSKTRRNPRGRTGPRLGRRGPRRPRPRRSSRPREHERSRLRLSPHACSSGASPPLPRVRDLANGKAEIFRAGRRPRVSPRLLGTARPAGLPAGGGHGPPPRCAINLLGTPRSSRSPLVGRDEKRPNLTVAGFRPRTSRLAFRALTERLRVKPQTLFNLNVESRTDGRTDAFFSD